MRVKKLIFSIYPRGVDLLSKDFIFFRSNWGTLNNIAWNYNH